MMLSPSFEELISKEHPVRIVKDVINPDSALEKNRDFHYQISNA